MRGSNYRLHKVNRHRLHLVIDVDMNLRGQNVAVSGERHEHANAYALVCQIRDERAPT
jgi:hypothetical protein